MTGVSVLLLISLLAMKKQTGQTGAVSVSALIVPNARITVPLSRRATVPIRGPSPMLRYRDSDGYDEVLVTSTPTREDILQDTPAPIAVDEERALPQRGVRMLTVRSLVTSQLLVFTATMMMTVSALFFSGHGLNINTVHWNGGTEFYSLWDFQLNPMRLLEGFLAATPMIFLGSQLEHSERRDASHVDFSTINMVMTLFGRRKHEHAVSPERKGEAGMPHSGLRPETSTFQTILLSFGLAILTGMTEEILFRGVIAAAIAYQTQSIAMALFGQAMLFGLGHVSPQATPGENKIVAGFQTSNALWHGVVYLLAGGDVLPCIVAHALYDSHVFVETWTRTNNQMDYTETKVQERLTAEEEDKIRQIRQEAGPSLTPEILAFARRFFYAFDSDHRGSLSRKDLQRAISYAFLHDKVQPSQAQVSEVFDRMLQRRLHDVRKEAAQDEGRLTITEFLRILFLLKARPHAA